MKTRKKEAGDADELFDVLDLKGARTGEKIPRAEAHRTGAWHGAFHCLIIGLRNGQGRALFQKRSSSKAIAPGKFDVSVGGHYSAGEDAAAAGPREIREELGLRVRFESLVPVGRRVFVYGFTPGVFECELQDVFLLPRTVDPAALALCREEVAGVLDMDVEEGIRLFSGRSERAGAFLFRPGGEIARVRVAAREFVPCLDNYYLKLLLLSRRHLAGERELLLI
jgi:isopentenyldiphosphate isomerase